MFDFEYFIIYVSMLYKFYGFLHLEIFDKCINRNWLTIPRSINICCRTHRPTLNSPDDWSEKEGEKEREGNGGSEKSRDSPRGANLPQKITHGKRWTRVFFWQRAPYTYAIRNGLRFAKRQKRLWRARFVFVVQLKVLRERSMSNRLILYSSSFFFVVYRLK